MKLRGIDHGSYRYLLLTCGAFSMLLDAGANPNARDKQKRFPLRWAAITVRLCCPALGPMTDCQQGRSDICELLLSHGACATLVDLEGSDSLHAAAWYSLACEAGGVDC